MSKIQFTYIKFEIFTIMIYFKSHSQVHSPLRSKTQHSLSLLRPFQIDLQQRENWKCWLLRTSSLENSYIPKHNCEDSWTARCHITGYDLTSNKAYTGLVPSLSAPPISHLRMLRQRPSGHPLPQSDLLWLQSVGVFHVVFPESSTKNMHEVSKKFKKICMRCQVNESKPK